MLFRSPRAVNKAGTHSGLYQFGDAEWKKYGGGGDIYDPNAQFDAYVKYQRDIQQTMRGALNRDPTNPELYLGWQQGAGGASSLLKNADKPVGQLTTIANITANGGTPDMTGGQFASLWVNTYNDKQRKLLGQQGQWQGEGDTTDSPWISAPPGVKEAPAYAPTPDVFMAADRTKNDADLAGNGGSPRLAAAQPDDAAGRRVAAASSKLTGMGLGLLSAGEAPAPQQSTWIRQAMSEIGRAHV